MLYLELENGSGWMAVRPSGTEPKLKLYFGYSNPDPQKAEKTLEALMKEAVIAIKE
ncbi:MAG: hypothetical protein UIL37_04910 [Clostridia bacterium]|nr:hypothetical protein [Clostridia bacterium]